jgi:putative mRNA 3-end processing factor
MLQGGPAMQYLLRLNENSRTIFTGYCVENTNGYNLLNYGFVEYDGVKIKPKAAYSYLDFSAHAGRTELFEFVEKISPEKVFCVHGDSCVEFAEELKLEGFDAYAPSFGEKIKI